MPETVKKPRKKAVEAAKAPKAGVSTSAAQKPAKSPKKTGRPSNYDPDTAHQICELLSEGTPLRVICRMEGMPAWRTVYSWMTRDADLSAHIARAREVGYDNIAEECLHIADTPEWGEEVTETVDDKGKTVVSKRRVDLLGHRKLQVETRLKLLAKWRPDKYGDKTILAGDPNGAPIKTEDKNADKFLEIIRNMEMTKRAG